MTLIWNCEVSEAEKDSRGTLDCFIFCLTLSLISDRNLMFGLVNSKIWRAPLYPAEKRVNFVSHECFEIVLQPQMLLASNLLILILTLDLCKKIIKIMLSDCWYQQFQWHLVKKFIKKKLSNLFQKLVIELSNLIAVSCSDDVILYSPFSF